MAKKFVLLSFGAHPDDMEFTCAGTLALLHKKGVQIHVRNMCKGDLGSFTLSRDQITKVRTAECVKAAKMIGATYKTAGVGDFEIDYTSRHRKMATNVFREVDPDIVFTLPAMDYHRDHEEVSTLARFACFAAGVPHYVTGRKPTTKQTPYLYYWDPIDLKQYLGNIASAQFYIDITKTMDVKIKMLEAHASQMKWLQGHHKISQFVEMVINNSRDRGKQVGVKYAECFNQHLAHPYPQDNIVKEFLKEYYIPAPKKR